MKQLIAKLLFRLGFKYCVSTDIAGNTTKGYGKLDNNGFWQYQLPYNYEEKFNIMPKRICDYCGIVADAVVEDNLTFWATKTICSECAKQLKLKGYTL